MLVNFTKIKNEVLGKDYDLSTAFLSPAQIKKINKHYRNKDKATNVLAFPYSKKEGEILLCPEVIQKEARTESKTYAAHLGFLFIHGLLHLKGMRHGSIMERLEKKYDQKYFHRHRPGVTHHARGGRGIYTRREKS